MGVSGTKIVVNKASTLHVAQYQLQQSITRSIERKEELGQTGKLERIPSTVARAAEWNQKAAMEASSPTTPDVVKQADEEKNNLLHLHHEKFKEAVARVVE